ncbi:hypothetical protein LIER_30021 [Lithospermum erythrorhizon]|uniref:Uncharacterized protein n=1 Tax=Lithospermum erythrorhizon TaxID=34254 RepID=A0AAV3RS35_LITER
MSVTAESPVSSNSDDFASFLEDELDVASDGSPQQDEFEGLNCNLEENQEDDLRIKRRKLDELEEIVVVQKSITGESHRDSICPPHPGDMGGMCIRCGQMVDNESSVKVSYIHKVPSYT